jgi:hypothetical protein
MEATTRTSSIRRCRSMQLGSPHRSWSRSPVARTPRPPSSASCGSCAASATRTPSPSWVFVNTGPCECQCSSAHRAA